MSPGLQFGSDGHSELVIQPGLCSALLALCSRVSPSLLLQSLCCAYLLLGHLKFLLEIKDVHRVWHHSLDELLSPDHNPARSKGMGCCGGVRDPWQPHCTELVAESGPDEVTAVCGLSLPMDCPPSDVRSFRCLLGSEARKYLGVHWPQKPTLNDFCLNPPTMLQISKPCFGYKNHRTTTEVLVRACTDPETHPSRGLWALIADVLLSLPRELRWQQDCHMSRVR